MSGSKTALLTAFATAAQIAPMWDHTYVASSCGWVWRCWGNCSGGSPLVQRHGDSFVANCLSKPNGTAGIRYGRDGVCHQTANRILDPAGIKVTGARGYLTSYKFFGHYGSQPWARRTICYSSNTAPTEFSIYEAVSAQSIAGRKDPVMAVDNLNLTPFAAVDERGRHQEASEIRELFDPHLEQPLSDAEVEELHKIFLFARSEQQRLDRDLEYGHCSPESYVRKITELTRMTSDMEMRLLGQHRFVQVFGEAGFQPEGLIDPEEFLPGLRQSESVSR